MGPAQCLIAVIGIVFSVSVCAGEPAQVTSETLLRTSSSWDGVAYEYPMGQAEVTVLKITIPPHTTLPWHSHPMPNAAYVLSGELTVEKFDEAKSRHLRAGEVLPEMVGTRHRGYTGDNAAVLIVFYAGVKGMPQSQPAD